MFQTSYRKFHGQIFFSYLTWYGFGRFWIEQLRSDSLYIGNSDIRISQWVGALCFLGGLTVLIVGFIRARKHPMKDLRVPAQPSEAAEARADERPAAVSDVCEQPAVQSAEIVAQEVTDVGDDVTEEILSDEAAAQEEGEGPSAEELSAAINRFLDADAEPQDKNEKGED